MELNDFILENLSGVKQKITKSLFQVAIKMTVL